MKKRARKPREFRWCGESVMYCAETDPPGDRIIVVEPPDGRASLYADDLKRFARWLPAALRWVEEGEK